MGGLEWGGADEAIKLGIKMGNQCTPGRLRGPCGSSQHAGLGRSTCPLRSGSRFLLGCFALLFVLLFFFSPATFEGLFLCVYFCPVRADGGVPGGQPAFLREEQSWEGRLPTWRGKPPLRKEWKGTVTLLKVFTKLKGDNLEDLGNGGKGTSL